MEPLEMTSCSLQNISHKDEYSGIHWQNAYDYDEHLDMETNV